MKIAFSEDAFVEYIEWQKQDKKTLDRINELIKDIQRNGLLKGIGNPEFLKHLKVYSRRIDKFNRICYIGDNESVTILSCKGHYNG